MDTVEQIKEVENQIKALKVHAELGAALERLSKNRDFIKIVVEGYFEKEAVRLVHAKSNPALQSADKQAGIIKDIDGIGSLVQFPELIHANGKRAVQNIKEGEETIAEILQEEAAEEKAGA